MKLELQFVVVYYLFYGLSKVTLVVSNEGYTVQPTLILLLFLRAVLLLLTWLYVVRIHNCNLVRAVKFFQIKVFSIPWTGFKWESFVILTLCEKQFFARLLKVDVNDLPRFQTLLLLFTAAKKVRTLPKSYKLLLICIGLNS